MTTNLYVDETKAKGYLVVAATTGASSGDLAVIRKEIKTLLLPGQRSLHMKSEKDQRRVKIADTFAAMAALGVRAIVYDAGRGGKELERRSRAIEALVENAASMPGPVRITFDLDETVMGLDQQQMIELTRQRDLKEQISYTHQHRHSEPLLAIPDAIAWCWARGGRWRDRVRPLVTEINTI